MKTTFSKLLGLALLAAVVTACGGSSNTVPNASNISGYQTGSSSVASGAIGFSGSGVSITQTSVLAGIFPSNSGIGSYGQLMAGSNISSGGAMIQFQPKQGTNGTLQLSGNMNSIYGTLQLSQTLTQQILQYYGPNAQVTSMAIWATDLLQQNTYQTYVGVIAQAVVYLYINGSYQPIGPIVF
jgi:hypothetical protein